MNTYGPPSLVARQLNTSALAPSKNLESARQLPLHHPDRVHGGIFIFYPFPCVTPVISELFDCCGAPVR